MFLRGKNSNLLLKLSYTAVAGFYLFLSNLLSFPINLHRRSRFMYSFNGHLLR